MRMVAKAAYYQHLAFLGAKSAMMSMETGQIAAAIAYQQMAEHDAKKARKLMEIED